MVSELVKKALKRPANYYRLSNPEQWKIDQEVGVLDLEEIVSAKDIQTILNHHKEFLSKNTIAIFKKEINRIEKEQKEVEEVIQSKDKKC